MTQHWRIENLLSNCCSTMPSCKADVHYIHEIQASSAYQLLYMVIGERAVNQQQVGKGSLPASLLYVRLLPLNGGIMLQWSYSEFSKTTDHWNPCFRVRSHDPDAVGLRCGRGHAPHEGTNGHTNLPEKQWRDWQTRAATTHPELVATPFYYLQKGSIQRLTGSL